MLTKKHIELAKKYCDHYHKGQYRKGSNMRYASHPYAVADILTKYGYDDPITLCIAYLHDTVEDSELNMNKVQEIFGYEISNGVYILSKNKGKMKDGQKLSHADYLQRLSWARNKIKRVKIADMIDNTRDLQSLKPEGINQKIQDAEEFYISWGKEIAPLMAEELVANIANYRNKFNL